MSAQSNPIDSTWWIVENPTVPGELITLTSGDTKYVLVFTAPEPAAIFLHGMNDPNLQIVSLEKWPLKDAFLTAAKILGAHRIMFDYARGQQTAQSALLEGLIELMKSRFGI